MAHASPVSPAPGTPGATKAVEQGAPRAPETPDVFSERTHAVAHWALPAALALIYGYWAAAIDRGALPDVGAAAGAITGWNLLFGFVTAFVFMALYTAVRAVAPRLRRESRALAWAAFTGIAFGFIYSQSDASVLRSTVMALLVAAPVFAVAFYRYYTHEDAEGHWVG
ncbi:hypothetical protein ACFS5L_33365 [Streptomyces phyllanthi]|uniref:Uncharacterized protein n=1 Tax=Streptomyces phyllanthi TaxID=1803180 RepID=A0A5N8W1W6_9ACTN|nr:hypothetical protein [Streptomyces phyllanthi]MPY40866.1 hypothetical protein [Streptomyces phyllanthi]